MSRAVLRARSLTAALVVIFAASPMATAAQVRDADVSAVLTRSKAAELLDGMGGQMIAAIAAGKPVIDTATTNRAVRLYFSTDSLLAFLAADFKGRATPTVLADVQKWLLADSIVRPEKKGDSLADRETLEQYAARISAALPPEPRIRLAREFMIAQKAGEFYVEYVTAMRDAVGVLANASKFTGPQIAPMTREDIATIKQQYEQSTVVAFLQRFEPLTDVEGRRLIDAYKTASGQWYVSAYTASVAASIRAAAAKAAAMINSSS